MCQICFFGNIRYFFIVRIQILLIPNYRYINGSVLCESKAGFEDTSFMDRDQKCLRSVNGVIFCGSKITSLYELKKGQWIGTVESDSKVELGSLIPIFLKYCIRITLFIFVQVILLIFMNEKLSISILLVIKLKKEKLCVMRVFEEQQN